MSADWGGCEGIGAELRDIQHQIDHLGVMTGDPERVSQFLQIRKEVMFLEFDCAVRFSMRETFLMTNNMQVKHLISD